MGKVVEMVTLAPATAGLQGAASLHDAWREGVFWSGSRIRLSKSQARAERRLARNLAQIEAMTALRVELGRSAFAATAVDG
jgi:hypothetical protein